jgi:hypothetical protein
MKLKSKFFIRGRLEGMDYMRNMATIHFCGDTAVLHLSRNCDLPPVRKLREGVFVKAEGNFFPLNGKFAPVADKLILEEE